MQFVARRKRQPPTVIIVSLIDVLIVVLIFLMVTTTFKQLPAVQLALPVSREARAGATENAPLILSVPKSGPLYLKGDPITMDSLRQKLAEAVKKNPETTLDIRADTDTPFGEMVKVMDAAKEAGIKLTSAYVKSAK